MLRREILLTLAYYDVLDMPLTKEEVFRYLVRIDSVHFPSMQDVTAELAFLVSDRKLYTKNGYYYLFEKEYLIPLRNKRINISIKKWQKTLRIVKFLRIVPYIRAVFGSGSLALKNTGELSDLDIFIITKNGRIWSSRLMMSIVLTLFGARRSRNNNHAPDKICPNHFITDRSLRIEFQNMYTAQLYSNLIPIICYRKDILKEFQIENEWIFKFMHHWQIDESMIMKDGFLDGVRIALEFLLDRFGGDSFENFARWYQRNRISKSTEPIRIGGHLSYTDEVLAFHSGSLAGDILKKYEETAKLLT